MTEGNRIIKNVLSIAFIAILFIGFIKNGSYLELNSIFEYLKLKDYGVEDAVSLSMIENEYCASIWKKKELIDLNGLMAKVLNMQGLYSDVNIYITDDNYIVSSSDYTTTDYEYEELVGFHDFLEVNEINLLYVNEPTKYIDDSFFRYEFGVETYSNRNMDVLLDRIREAGVNTIDLRENISQDNINVVDLFYRTDHHWTTPAGLWATQIISQGLNDYCGYNIDTSTYDSENFTATQWESCWLGEQGRKAGRTYVGLDNYTELKPSFETSYTFKNSDGTTYEGTFDNFVDETVYNTEKDVYENDSWHYSYKTINCINNEVRNGKILILGDSYDNLTHSFLSLSVHEIDSLVLREYDDGFSIRNHIIENGYDTVIVAYAQFMVGAHDDQSSANYRMFTFD